MNEPQLLTTNVEYLVRGLNNIIDASEGTIIKGDFIDTKLRNLDRNAVLRLIPFFDLLTQRMLDLEDKGEYSLIQHDYDRGSLSSVDRTDFGSISVESWYKVTQDIKPEKHERLILMINYPLLIKEGKQIPECKVEYMGRILAEGRRPRGQPMSEIKYHKPRAMGLFGWKAVDLSDVLPKRFFTPRTLASYELKPTGTGLS